MGINHDLSSPFGRSILCFVSLKHAILIRNWKFICKNITWLVVINFSVGFRDVLGIGTFKIFKIKKSVKIEGMGMNYVYTICTMPIEFQNEVDYIHFQYNSPNKSNFCISEISSANKMNIQKIEKICIVLFFTSTSSTYIEKSNEKRNEDYGM